jgi:hypothetical protein
MATRILLWMERGRGQLVRSFAFPAASYPLSGASQMVPPCFDASGPIPTLPPLAGKATAGSCGLSTKMMVHASRYAGTQVVPGARKPPSFCLQCRCIAFANPHAALLAAFSRPPSRYPPWSYRPPVLSLLYADETSSAQLTISVVSLQVQGPRREEAKKGRCAVGSTRIHQRFAPRTSLCLCRRNNACPVMFLAVHVASGHEAGCDGPFHVRHHTLLLRCGAVPFAPPPDA